MFIPLTLPLALLVGLGSLSKWKKDNLIELIQRLRWALAGSIVVGALLPFLMHTGFHWTAALGLMVALWVFSSIGFGVYHRVANKQDKLAALAGLPRGFWGMSVAHLGIGVFIVGVTLTNVYSIEDDIGAGPGDVHGAGGYDFVFRGVEHAKGPNYDVTLGRVEVFRDDRHLMTLSPEKRFYRVETSPMTEAAIDAGLTRDLYVALGEPVDDQGSWTLRIYYKSFIRWIWMGALFMAIGGVLAASDRRYRAVQRDTAPAGAELKQGATT
jgi:cytochrome c-type biogenesis protein CcmF